MLAAICFSYFNPALNLIHSYRATSETKANLQRLAAENAKLKAKTESIADPSVLTREARRQGMVVPGERPYVVRGLGG